MNTCGTSAHRRWEAAAGSVYDLNCLVCRRGDVIDEGGFGHSLLQDGKG